MPDESRDGGRLPPPRPPSRDYASLYLALCTCGGPQPSRDRSKADEHMTWCAYRQEVEPDAEERE